MTDEAQAIIEEMISEGSTPKDIMYAMEDGAYLETLDISQAVCEEVHTWARANA